MRLIKRIETNYFRSIYSEVVKDISHCNVFVGANDCGKSNFLRALNLFFNNETGYDEDLNFIQDVTHFRQQEAKDAKGRLTIWMKIHFENTVGWGTLPKNFWIKKVWNRYSEFPEITSSIKSQTSTTTTRFLNKIEFHYVPAVKEKDIFRNYLSLLYETLASSQNIQFDKPASNLSKAINKATVQLAERIKLSLDVKSAINIPSDFQTIFEKLEFTTKQDGVDVPLANRGDGLQVRHIPHILDYVSRHNKKLNIWGYEEPENSLEMSNCFSLANQFISNFSEDNQIFITSHSPAFYGINGDNVSHYLVKKIERKNGRNSNEVTIIKCVSDMSVIDTELGVAQLIMARSAEAYKEISILKDANKSLEHFVKPVLLTEGTTDVDLLRTAWKKLYSNKPIPFEIESCDIGHPEDSSPKAGASQLKKVLEATTSREKILRIGLFDNDTEGRKCFDNLSNHHTIDLGLPNKANRNRKSAALLLPSVDWDDPYFKYTDGDITIEMLLPRKSLASRDVAYKFQTGSGSIKKGEMDRLISSLSVADIKKLVKAKIEFPKKKEFCEKIKEFEKTDFDNFKILFDNIETLIGHITD